MSINEKVAVALTGLLDSNLKGIVEAVITNQYFIAFSRQNNLKFNQGSEIAQVNIQDYIIVDTTSKIFHKNEDLYDNKARDLFYIFDSIEKWYDC